MIIETTKTFDKQYTKLSQKDKQKFRERLGLFMVSPLDISLNNHGLKGKYLGYRSINVSGDLRALYTVKGDRIVLFAFIGTHSQLYG